MKISLDEKKPKVYKWIHGSYKIKVKTISRSRTRSHKENKHCTGNAIWRKKNDVKKKKSEWEGGTTREENVRNGERWEKKRGRARVKGRRRECERMVRNVSYVRTRNAVRDATLRDLADHERPARANNGSAGVCVGMYMRVGRVYKSVYAWIQHVASVLIGIHWKSTLAIVSVRICGCVSSSYNQLHLVIPSPVNSLALQLGCSIIVSLFTHIMIRKQKKNKKLNMIF